QISPAMNSGNHPALGAVGRWIYENIGGISAGGPGFKIIIIRPLVDRRVGFADMSYRSVYGLIRSSWKISGSRLVIQAEIPANTTAEIHIPAARPDAVRQPDGQGACFLRRENGRAVYSAGSGVYCFKSVISKGVIN
ncbi:MAG: alpha-L-rhamnosidase C-terminal domain-containing protein, partial [Kiritimatiellia bacterium]